MVRLWSRFFDPQIGRWHRTDNKAELYLATSPYAYALNQPTNAIDPDGNIVIFIQGNHFGETKHAYWTSKNYYTKTGPRGGETPDGYHSVSSYGSTTVYGKNRYFDTEVMTQLGDDKAAYYDGSGGGWGGVYKASKRIENGYSAGEKDAKEIIENLARDKNGNIIETIKIVTHSMGGAYGKDL